MEKQFKAWRAKFDDLILYVLYNSLWFVGENMNYFLNENWREVTKELGPALGEAIGEVFRLLLSNIADLVPYEYIYPDTPAPTS